MKVLVVTGPSGGHIFPALGFLDTLKAKYKNIDALLILPKRSIAGPMPKYRHAEDVLRRETTFGIGTFGYDVNYISISPIKLSLDFKNFFAILEFFKGSLESLFIMLRFRPDIVVGFGSLVSIPLVMFAWVFRIKTLIHEQNVIPGRADRLLAKFTDRIAISFAKTQDYFKDCKRKIALTGNPIRKELIRIDKDRALDFFGFNSNKFTILVMGGSLGSHSINVGFLRTISTIPEKSNLQIIHLAGYKDYDLLKQSYESLNIDIKLFRFLNSMQYAYSASDLVLSRAGATTIAEIIFYALAAIIIPYPYAYKHQIANAKVLERMGSAIIVDDNDLDSGILIQVIESLVNNPDRLKNMRSIYRNFLRPHANDLLVNEVMSLN